MDAFLVYHRMGPEPVLWLALAPSIDSLHDQWRIARQERMMLPLRVGKVEADEGSATRLIPGGATRLVLVEDPVLLHPDAVVCITPADAHLRELAAELA